MAQSTQNDREHGNSNAKTPNLAAQIAATIDREPGDLVKCTWIGGDNYRCNWWAARIESGKTTQAIPGMTYGAHVVRLSRFLTVTTTAAGLNITSEDDVVVRR